MKVKATIKRAWLKVKKWFYGVLVAIGIVTLPLALAGEIGFNWTNATTRTDGTAFDAATEQLEIRIYCNGDTAPTFVSSGAAEALSQIVTPGEYTCYATTVDLAGIESFPSNSVTKTVVAAMPNPPVLEP